MSFKKILLSIIILILLFFYVYFIVLVKGNPFSRINTEKKLQSYLEDTYPQKEFHIKYYRYDPEFGYYLFYVRKADDNDKTKYLFEVPTFISDENEIEDGIFYAHLDEDLNKKWSKEVIEDLKRTLVDIAPEIREAEVYLFVLENKYAKSERWDPSKKMDKPMNIHLILDGEDLSKNEVMSVTKSIQKVANERGYDYDEFALNFYIPYEGDWIVRYTTIFSPNQTIKESDFEIHNEFLFE